MKRIVARAAMFVLGTGVFFAVAGRAPAEDELSVQLYKKNVNSVVVIHAISKDGGGRGSGSLIDAKRRLVLTNWHVVEELPRVWVDFPLYSKKGKDDVMVRDPALYLNRALKGQAISAKVLHRDKARDLAVVQLDRLPATAVALPLARKVPKVGETVWNIGSPGRVSQLFGTTEGKVRAVGEVKFVVGALGDDAFEVQAMAVTTSNPINPGDSGGPLYDKRGYQIAVTQSGEGGTVQQVNHFIAVSEVREFLKEKKVDFEELTPPEDGDPGPETPKAGPGTGPAPKKELPATTSTPEDEKAAATALRIAKGFGESEDQKSLYVRKLEDVIKKYPATAAAKEAKKLLSQVK